MKFLLPLLGLLATASATCYNSGTTWNTRNNARYHAGRACRGYDGNPGAFSGTFRPGEKRCVCVTSDANPLYLYVLEVTNLNTNTAFDIGDEDCLRELAKEIDGCERGGSSDNAGWRFRADPGYGQEPGAIPGLCDRSGQCSANQRT